MQAAEGPIFKEWGLGVGEGVKRKHSAALVGVSRDKVKKVMAWSHTDLQKVMLASALEFQNQAKATREFESKNLMPFLAALGVTRRRVRAEGDCMFLALVVSMEGDASDGELDAKQLVLRNSLADYIYENRAEYEDFVVGVFEEWLANLRLPLVEWGEHVCLHAAANKYGRNIDILEYKTTDDAPVLITLEADLTVDPQPLRVLHYAERHYDGILMP